MAQALKAYHAREPRYVLQLDANRVVRFAYNNEIYAEATTLLNISLSGLAFLVNAEYAPQTGSMIKIEFTVPGTTQMACYAQVVRNETFLNEKCFVLVAVKFIKLSVAQRLFIAKGLASKYQKDKLQFVLRYKKQLAIYILLVLFLIVALYDLASWQTIGFINQLFQR